MVFAAGHEGDDAVTPATVFVHIVAAHGAVALALLHQFLHLGHRRDLDRRVGSKVRVKVRVRVSDKLNNYLAEHMRAHSFV